MSGLVQWRLLVVIVFVVVVLKSFCIITVERFDLNSMYCWQLLQAEDCFMCALSCQFSSISDPGDR